MPYEPIKRTEVPTGNTRTTDSIISEDGGAGAGWPIALLVLVTFVAGFWFLTQASGANASYQDPAVQAAGDTGETSTQGVGRAAEKTISE